jgi:hypothetical protein
MSKLINGEHLTSLFALVNKQNKTTVPLFPKCSPTVPLRSCVTVPLFPHTYRWGTGGTPGRREDRNSGGDMTTYRDMAAIESFHHILARTLDLGLLPPCFGDGSYRWLSEDPRDRGQAMLECRVCPIMRECDQLAEAILPTHGVWGARDWTQARIEGKHPSARQHDHVRCMHSTQVGR